MQSAYLLSYEYLQKISVNTFAIYAALSMEIGTQS